MKAEVVMEVCPDYLMALGVARGVPVTLGGRLARHSPPVSALL